MPGFFPRRKPGFFPPPHRRLCREETFYSYQFIFKSRTKVDNPWSCHFANKMAHLFGRVAASVSVGGSHMVVKEEKSSSFRFFFFSSWKSSHSRGLQRSEVCLHGDFDNGLTNFQLMRLYFSVNVSHTAGTEFKLSTGGKNCN